MNVKSVNDVLNVITYGFDIKLFNQHLGHIGGQKRRRRRGPGRTDYLRPTPMGVPLELRSRIKEIKGRKVVVESTLSAKGEICARGEVVAVQMPEKMMAGIANP